MTVYLDRQNSLWFVDLVSKERKTGSYAIWRRHRSGVCTKQDAVCGAGRGQYVTQTEAQEALDRFARKQKGWRIAKLREGVEL